MKPTKRTRKPSDKRPAKLSDVESQWRKAYDYYPVAEIRKLMRRAAYHEAAHVAARMFTGLESGHVRYISILPELGSFGRFCAERMVAKSLILNKSASYPAPLKLTRGYCLLLEMLAGRAATFLLGDDEPILCPDSEEWEDEGTDLFVVGAIAEAIARPHYSRQRILHLAEKWTLEMLDLPEAWGAVEKTAALLLKRGIIDDRAEILELYDSIMWKSLWLPKWKRRLHPSNASMRPFISPHDPPAVLTLPAP